MFEHLKIEMKLREEVAAIFSEVSQWGHAAVWQQTIPSWWRRAGDAAPAPPTPPAPPSPPHRSAAP